MDITPLIFNNEINIRHCLGAHLHLRGWTCVGAALVADHTEDGHHYDTAASRVHQ